MLYPFSRPHSIDCSLCLFFSQVFLHIHILEGLVVKNFRQLQTLSVLYDFNHRVCNESKKIEGKKQRKGERDANKQEFITPHIKTIDELYDAIDELYDVLRDNMFFSVV